MPIQPTPSPSPPPNPTAATPPGFALEWLRSVLATKPNRPGATPAQIAQGHDATLVWLDALRAHAPGDAMLAGQAVSMHLTAMELLRQANARDLSIELACRLRSNATAMTRVSLTLISRLLDRQGARDAGGVPDLATMRDLLPETAPVPPEPTAQTAPATAAATVPATAAETASETASESASESASPGAAKTSHGGTTP